MGVIGVEKDFERSCLAQALHNRRGLASTEEFAFALRGTEDYRQAQLGGGVGHRLADGEFGEVEVADSSAVSVAMSEDFAVCAWIGATKRKCSHPEGLDANRYGKGQVAAYERVILSWFTRARQRGQVLEEPAQKMAGQRKKRRKAVEDAGVPEVLERRYVPLEEEDPGGKDRQTRKGKAAIAERSCEDGGTAQFPKATQSR